MWAPTYNNCMDLAALLTEQANPASAHIDKLSTEEMLRVINAEDRKVAESVARGNSQNREGGGRDCGRVPQWRQALLYRRGHQRAGWECWMPRNVRRRSTCPPDLVQGIIAGGEAALSRATETTEDDPAIGARDLHGARVSRRTTCCAALPPAAGRPMCWARSTKRTGWAR